MNGFFIFNILSRFVICCLVVVVGFLCAAFVAWLFFGLCLCFGLVFGVCWL